MHRIRCNHCQYEQVLLTYELALAAASTHTGQRPGHTCTIDAKPITEAPDGHS